MDEVRKFQRVAHEEYWRIAELAEELVRALLADHPREKTISLLAISVSHIEEHWDVELELPLGLADEARRPGTKRGMARWAADHAVDRIRDRFGWDAIGYGSVALGISPSVPDEFRRLAEKGRCPVTVTRASDEACCHTPT